MRRWTLLPLLLLPLTALGCGGGDGPSEAFPRLELSWAERTRAVGTPTSALSARITLVHARADGGDVAFVVNRPAGPAGQTTEATSPQAVRVGPVTVRVQFHVGDAAGGDEVGTATFETRLQRSGVLTRSDGTPLGVVGYTGVIHTVEVAAGQSVGVGASADLAFTARKADGGAVAVSRGSARWTLVGGDSVLGLSADGQATGKAAGSATVRVSVDGKASADTTVSVLGPATVKIEPPTAVVIATGNVKFAASIEGQPSAAFTWTVQEGDTGGTVSDGFYQAPATTGTYHVIATSTSDPSKTATAEVTVAAEVDILFDNGNIWGVQNGPANPTTFTLADARLITRVRNYHWNSSSGSTPGRISLRHSDGTVYGPWQCSGSTGQGGVPNAYWWCYPNVTIKAGTYTVIDSEPATWSHNSGSNYSGFTYVEGSHKP